MLTEYEYMDEPALRISDHERQQAAEILQRHFIAGRLTLVELQHRMQDAIVARTGRDLAGVLHDLPRLDPAASAPTNGVARPSATRHAVSPLNKRDQREIR